MGEALSAVLPYLALAAALSVFGYFHTGRVVRPKWKLWGKLARYLLLTGALAHFFGAWSLVYIFGDFGLGLAFHTWVCRKHDIDWWTLAPEERYVALTEKWARGEFGG